MPSLRRWLDRESERLWAQGRQALAVRFDAFCDAFFGGDYPVALRLIPEVRALAERLGEREWVVLMDYYAASAAGGWRGHLGDALEIVTGAVVQAGGMAQAGVIGAYVREALLATWLDIDGPGYLEHIAAALDEIPSEEMPRDLRARFEGVRARCEALAGDGEGARTRWLAALPHLDWPRHYVAAAQADSLLWVGRYAEAAALYEQAAAGFDADHLSIEGNAVRLARAESLLLGGHPPAAERVARLALQAAQRSINRAQVGMAEGLLGRAAAAQGQPDEAAVWTERALAALDGLGWWRLEAEIAVGYVARLAALGDVAGVEAARATAAWCIHRLGPDSQAELERELEAVS